MKLAMDGLTVWLLGWAAMSGLMGLVLNETKKDNHERAASASIRSLWGERSGRAVVILVLFPMWPLFVPVAIRSLWAWACRTGASK